MGFRYIRLHFPFALNTLFACPTHLPSLSDTFIRNTRNCIFKLRNRSRFLQTVTRIDGKLRQTSTKTSHLPTAFKLAEDWYKREVRASRSFGMSKAAVRLTHDPTMAELFASYRGMLTPKREAYALQKWSPIAPFLSTTKKQRKDKADDLV
jgi:hypothetical protein